MLLPDYLLNEQEVFDKIITSLRKQGKKSEDENGVCLYRGEDNCKCAVGHLIPDDLYHPSMETWGIDSFEIRRALLEVVDHSSFDLITAMQRIHDRNLVSQWESSFRYVAKFYNLIYV